MVQCPASSTVFSALGDPTRLRIVELLSAGERSVSVLAAELSISLPGTLKHLRLLEDAGLLTRSKSGRTVTCRLDPAGLERGEEWLQRTRLFWAGQLIRLHDHFEEDT